MVMCTWICAAESLLGISCAGMRLEMTMQKAKRRDEGEPAQREKEKRKESATDKGILSVESLFSFGERKERNPTTRRHHRRQKPSSRQEVCVLGSSSCDSEVLIGYKRFRSPV